MKKLEKPILAEGEVTGHAHVLEVGVEVFETEQKTRQFKLDVDTNLSHEEHKTITLPPGEFESDRVLEYDPFQEEARKVQD